ETCDEGVDVVGRVVKSQRGARRRGHAETLDERLGAMMPGPYRDAMLVENGADVVRVHPVHDERKDSRSLARAPDEPNTGYSANPLVGVIQECLLVRGNRRPIDPGEVVECGSEPDRTLHVRRARFELLRNAGVGGAL